jgi:hypothetical protein
MARKDYRWEPRWWAHRRGGRWPVQPLTLPRWASNGSVRSVRGWGRLVRAGLDGGTAVARFDCRGDGVAALLPLWLALRCYGREGARWKGEEWTRASGARLRRERASRGPPSATRMPSPTTGLHATAAAWHGRARARGWTRGWSGPPSAMGRETGRAAH